MQIALDTILQADLELSVDQPMLAVDELAAIVRVQPATVRGWVRSGDGPPAVQLPGGDLRFPAGLARAWLERRLRSHAA